MYKKSLAGGILGIIAGAIGVIGTCVYLVFMSVFADLLRTIGSEGNIVVISLFTLIYLHIALCIVFNLISLIYSTKLAKLSGTGVVNFSNNKKTIKKGVIFNVISLILMLILTYIGVIQESVFFYVVAILSSVLYVCSIALFSVDYKSVQKAKIQNEEMLSLKENQEQKNEEEKGEMNEELLQ